ncbi:MAG: lamin tail domain-containing protein, partial [Candidatus Methanomethylophilaceae archaeon]|nr:lamin tail domain-containing protein [Candidatus Methanomethylophilaceae archaeon]
MRSVLAVSLLFLVCAFVPLASEYDAANTGIVLYEVNIFNEDEGVSLHNYSSYDIDLKDFCITDNPQKSSSEGSIGFLQSLIIHSGETLTFVKDKSADSGFPGRHTTYRNGESGVTISNNFALNNSKDDVYLFYGNNIIDAFFYGDVEITDKNLWSGDTFTPKKNSFAVR